MERSRAASLSRPAAALLAVAAAALGCAPDPPPLRLGLLVWPSFELFALAKRAEPLRDAPVQIVDYASPPEALRALRSGSIDATALTLDYAVELLRDGIDVRIVLVTDVSRGGDVLLARPGIAKLGDLRGRRVGAEASVLAAHLLYRALATGGLDRHALTVVPVDVDDHERVYGAGKLDAIVTYEPFATRLESLGARRLYSSAELDDEIVDVLVVRREVLEAQPARVRLLVDGWLDALDRLRREPEVVARALAPREGLSAADFLRTLDGMELQDRAANRRWLGGPEPALMGPLERNYEVLVALELLAGPLPLASLLDPRFVAEGGP